MDLNLLWECFEKSGKINDYLEYKKASEGENKDADDKRNSDILCRRE